MNRSLLSIPSAIGVCLLALTGLGCAHASDSTTSPATGAGQAADPAPAPADPAPAPADPAPGQIVLTLDAPLAIGSGLELVWRELRDSRCPQDVQCVWAGQVAIVVEILRAGADAVQHELPHDEVVAIGGGITLKLLDVTPYPRASASVERGDHRARVEVGS